MVLSVIIVNYRVRYFLELCLHSVEKALSGLDAEVIVIDNHSADGSVEFLRPLFPGVRFIVNMENTGFAHANNQALEHAKGEYVLFLNPDTILPEDIVPQCLSFLRSTPRIGGLGLRMIDGSGHFLKESRRGFPSPWVAFCKLSGLTALFPRSRAFSTYYLGFLPETGTHPAPVLSGACLWVSRAVLDEVGSFDSSFFMYAEDIDLSYRLEQAGYVNYYFADSTIIHFKGESTRKDSAYTRQFYKAMSQFRRKHFTRDLPFIGRAGLEAAIRLRAALGVVTRLFSPAVAATAVAATAAATTAPPTTAPADPDPAAPTRRTWCTGDPATTATIKKQIQRSAERMEAPDLRQAEEIIFCIGDGFSFKESIKALESAQLYRHGRQAKFFAAGCHSAVGSASKDNQGEVWLLDR
jgi:N-acetylglucosaminyl-diphospho-decaprenol L-rhamnosyltransferase